MLGCRESDLLLELAMAKRSQRSHFRRAKDRLVRVWGLMSILDYCHFRSPRKMLIYKRQRCREGPGKSRKEVEESLKFDENLPEIWFDREGTAGVGILREKGIGKEPEQSDLKREGHRKENYKITRMRSSQFLNKQELEARKNWELECPSQQNREQSLELGAKNMVEEFHRQMYPIHIEDGLSEAVKEVLNRQSICGKHREDVNVLRILQLSFFRKKSKFRDTRSSDENECAEAPDKIVTFKPVLVNPETVHLQNTGKEQRVRINTGSILSAIKQSLRSVNYFNKDRFHINKTSQLKAGEKNHKMIDNSELRVSNIYTDAKEYLSKMLSNGDQGSDIMAAAYSDKPGILSLSELGCCPRGSPRRDASITVKSRFSTVVEFPREIGNNADGNSVVPSEQIAETELSTYETVVEETAFDTEDHINWEENTRSDKSSHENCSIAHLREKSDDDECEQHLSENFEDENGLVLSPSMYRPCTLFMGKPDDQEIGIDKAEQPSPLSVLEPLHTEDDYRPTRTTSRSRGHPIQLLQIKFEDTDHFAAARDIYPETLDKGLIIGYVRAVLDASRLNWDELYLESRPSGQLVEFSMLGGEVDFLGDMPRSGKKILLDCINEVLLGFYGHYSVLPCFNNSNEASAIRKVCTRVYWHLLQPPLPRTLEQIIGKDLSTKETWMDLRFEVESLGVDMGDIILQELILDTFTSLVNRSQDSKELATI